MYYYHVVSKEEMGLLPPWRFKSTYGKEEALLDKKLHCAKALLFGGTLCTTTSCRLAHCVKMRLHLVIQDIGWEIAPFQPEDTWWWAHLESKTLSFSSWLKAIFKRSPAKLERFKKWLFVIIIIIIIIIIAKRVKMSPFNYLLLMSLNESQWVSISLNESQWVWKSLIESERVWMSLNESELFWMSLYESKWV